MNNSEQLAATLFDLGIRDVFCITGGHALFLNHALATHQSLNVTYFHHEQSASMAADAYFRIAQRPAVVNVSAGPAALNTLNGVYGSFVDSIPVIYVSGQPKTSQLVQSTGLPLRQYGDQEFDKIIELVAPITKHAIMLSKKDDIQAELRKAHLIATSGRPGPVWIDIPMDVQAEPYRPKYTMQDIVSDKSVDLVENNPTSGQVTGVVNALMAARRPLIYAGSGIRSSSSHGLFAELIDLLNIPVVTAWNAHDVIASDNELFVGRPGLRGERCGNWITHSADCIIFLGEHLTQRQIGYQSGDYSPDSFKVMVVDDINEAIKPNLNIDMVIFAGLSKSISALIYEASPHKAKFPAEWLTWKSRCRQIANDYLPKPSDYSRSTVFINPYHAIFAIFERLKEGDSIVTGNGISVVGVFQVARLKEGQRLFQNAGCASMGYDLPASIGASVAAGMVSRVVCITGDGSIQMNIQELQTMSELDANIIVFVLNNNGYDSIRQSQESIFGEGAKHFGISPETGISFPSLEKISGAYGLPYIRIKDYEDLQRNLERALLHEKVICEICVTNQQNFEPKTETKVAENGSLISGSLTDMKPYLTKKEIEEVLSGLVG